MVGSQAKEPLLAAIITWIPAEVLTAYKALDGLIPPDKSSFRLWFSLGMVPACALWIAFATKPQDKPVAWRQVVISPFAFICWAVALQSDMLKGLFPGWEPWIGSVILGIGTVLLPILDGILTALGLRQSS